MRFSEEGSKEGSKGGRGPAVPSKDELAEVEVAKESDLGTDSVCVLSHLGRLLQAGDQVERSRE